MVPFLEGDSFIFGVDCFFCPKRKYIKGSSSNFQLPGIFRCSAWWVWGGGLEGWNCLQYTPWNFNILAPDKRPFPSKKQKEKVFQPHLFARASCVSFRSGHPFFFVFLPPKNGEIPTSPTIPKTVQLRFPDSKSTIFSGKNGAPKWWVDLWFK